MKRATLALVVLALLALPLCTGCVRIQGESIYDGETQSIYGRVIRHIDHDAGAVCWLLAKSDGVPVGIHCLPLSQTRLGQ